MSSGAVQTSVVLVVTPSMTTQFHWYSLTGSKVLTSSDSMMSAFRVGLGGGGGELVVEVPPPPPPPEVLVVPPPPLPPPPPPAVVLLPLPLPSEREVEGPGMVQELSVPRYGSGEPDTGVHVGYDAGVKGQTAVVVSVVVVVPAVWHATTVEHAVV